MNTRTGKIARLPRSVREELNQRLDDGEAGPPLLEWLNAHWLVKEVLDEHFDSQAISEQNLSAWRQGGFVDWQRQRDARRMAQEFLGQVEACEEELSNEGSFADRMTEMIALMLGRLLCEAMTENGKERREGVLKIARELARLRRTDHAMRRLWIAEARNRAGESEEEAETEVEPADIDFPPFFDPRLIAESILKKYSEEPAGAEPPEANQGKSSQIKVTQAERSEAGRAAPVAGGCDPDRVLFVSPSAVPPSAGLGSQTPATGAP